MKHPWVDLDFRGMEMAADSDGYPYINNNVTTERSVPTIVPLIETHIKITDNGIIFRIFITL